MAILSIEAARNFAIVAHGKQVYASQFPYLTHLEGVVAILGEFGYTDDVMVASAYLHDTIEDTNVNY
jgi:(p)ppGpp synthase/HD superfamily hydrolase